MNESGDAAFVMDLRSTTRPKLTGIATEGLFRYTQADRKLVPLLLPGITPSPGDGTFESAGMRPTLNNSGDIVFPGAVHVAPGMSLPRNMGSGIFMIDRNGQFTKIVVPGDAAPGGGKFDFAQNPWINDRGDIAFGAHVAGEDCLSSPQLFCAESTYFKAAGSGTIESIAHQGEQVPPSVAYRSAWGPVLNNPGDIVFIAGLDPPRGVQEANGIFRYSHGVTTPIAIPGSVMPDNRKVVTVNPTNTVSNYSLNNLGEVSFNAALENGDSAFYVYSEGFLHLVAGTGTVLPGIGTIASVGSATVNGGILNDSSQIFFWATLTDGK